MKRLVRIARFIITAAILATVTILFLRGRDPALFAIDHRSPAERAMNRVIKRVHFYNIPFYQAIDELSRGAGVKIECDEAVASSNFYYWNVNLMADQITLRHALHALVALQSWQIHCYPEENRIRISYTGGPAERWYVGEYVIPDYVGLTDYVPSSGIQALFTYRPPPGPVPQLYDDGNVRALDMIPTPRDLGSQEGVVWNGRLFMLSAESAHDDLRDLLEALRPGAPAGARRVLLDGAEVLDYVDGGFRPRDTRTARDALCSRLDRVVIPAASLRNAIRMLGGRFHTQIVLANDAISDSPEVQLNGTEMTLADALEQLLHQFNSDTARGFRPDRDTIWISPQEAPLLERAYELRAYFAAQPDTVRRRRAEELLAQSYAIKQAQASGLFGSTLVVGGTWKQLEANEAELLRWLNARTRLRQEAEVP